MSKEGKSKHQLWQELCILISKNPEKVYIYITLCVTAAIHEATLSTSNVMVPMGPCNMT